MQSLQSLMGIYPSRSASTESNLPLAESNLPAETAEWAPVEEPVNQKLRRRRQQKADQPSSDTTPVSEEQPKDDAPKDESKKEESKDEPKDDNQEESDEECEECEDDEEIDPRMMIAVFRRPKCERCAAVLDILLEYREEDESSDEEVEEKQEEAEAEEEEEESNIPPMITNLFIVLFLIHLIQLFIKMYEPVPRYVFY